MRNAGGDSARWKQLDRLLDEILELPADQRSAFLDQACAGDDGLRREIERLMGHEYDVGSFIETPAFQDSSAPMNSSQLVSLLHGEPLRQTLLREGNLVAGRYQILTKLGKGGMGEVWHAFDQKLRIDLALKTLRLDLLQRAEDRVDLIRREVRTAREVISPNVCRIFDLVIVDDQEMISMEYIDGITLLQMMEQRGPLDLHVAKDVAAQFLTGLEAIHAAGLVHRDLKPENIMITRAGRVVVMDLGIAEQVAGTSGPISGTIPYMSPEQRMGEKLEPRSDIFSAGIILAEMVHTKGVQSKTTRETIWKAVRDDPMQLPGSPWKTVIQRAVAQNKEHRFESAAALSRALEEITLRVETDEALTPYPGLASFRETDRVYFFGREHEVETLIKKLQQQQIIALIGASGSGKTSLLQAGLIPVLPKEWGYAITHPGDAPLLNLVTSHQANAETSEVPHETVRILKRLRDQYTQFVLIIDRFEELFTLNLPAVQSQFADVLGRAAMEADIHILLAMRDDFLILCKGQPALDMIFFDLTAMLPLSGASLRRALVQPALQSGYRFEDENLIEEILRDVEKERSALPLLAFAASLLWEKRDRQKGLLTREAYKQIGGVQGALAQHAETMMAELGAQQESIVREIFCNLITAQQTRIGRETEELLSIFPNQTAARDVLNTCINARLLTSYDASGAKTKNRIRRVEISHESLITSWPRLVKWQMQDAENAQLRDQLRQAAQLWAEKGRSPDLLWTGTAFLEYQVWRQRYPGGLTSTEQAFAVAMTEQANKKRAQRQWFVAATIIVLLITVGIISNLWLKASASRDDAMLQARRAEATTILATARAIPDADPTTKLAYAIASLEHADTPHGRRFALQAIAQNPAIHIVEIGRHAAVDLSPDGRWIAVGGSDGSVDLLARDGSAAIHVQKSIWPNSYIQWGSQFSPNSDLLIYTWRQDPSVINVWSLSQKKIVKTFHFEGSTRCFTRAKRAFFVTDTKRPADAPFSWGKSVIRSWRFDSLEPEILGRVDLQDTYWRNLDIDSQGRWITYLGGANIHLRSLQNSEIGPEQTIGTNEGLTQFLVFHPNGNQLASADLSEIRIWSLVPRLKNPLRTIAETRARPWFDPKGSFLFASSFNAAEKRIHRWDLADENKQPAVFLTADSIDSLIFDPQQRWFAAGAGLNVAFYPMKDEDSTILRINGSATSTRFAPDMKFLLTGSDMDGIRLRNFPGDSSPGRTLWKSKKQNDPVFDIHPFGKSVIAAIPDEGIRIINIVDGRDTPLSALSLNTSYGWLAFSPDGKSAAGISWDGIEIWDIASGKSRILKGSKGKRFYSLAYRTANALISSDNDTGQVVEWDIANDTAKIIFYRKGFWVTSIASSRDGRSVAAVISSVKYFPELHGSTSELVIYDSKTGKSEQIISHGNRVFCVTFDPPGARLITGDLDGIVRAGPVTGEMPHLLLGHSKAVKDVAVDSSGNWIASTEFDSFVRLWRMPQGSPLETVPHYDFLNYLHAQTNVRLTTQKDAPGSYHIQYGASNGWESIKN